MRWTFLVILPLLMALARAYKKYNTQNMECTNPGQPYPIQLASSGQDSSIIVEADEKGGYAQNRACYWTVKAPEHTGILLDLNYVKLYKSERSECIDNLQVRYTNHNWKPYCDVLKYTLVTLISDPEDNVFDMKFITKRRDTMDDVSKYNFSITFTAYNRICGDEDFACKSRTCIWKDFVCDGTNNCPNARDETCEKPGGPDSHSTIIIFVFVGVGVLALVCCLYSTSKCRKIICARFRKRAIRNEPAQVYSPPNMSPEPSVSDVASVMLIKNPASPIIPNGPKVDDTVMPKVVIKRASVSFPRAQKPTGSTGAEQREQQPKQVHFKNTQELPPFGDHHEL